jgi:hypothetical protein
MKLHSISIHSNSRSKKKKKESLLVMYYTFRYDTSFSGANSFLLSLNKTEEKIKKDFLQTSKVHPKQRNTIEFNN